MWRPQPVEERPLGANLDYGAAFGGVYLSLFLQGARNTLILTFVCWALAISLSALVAIGRTSSFRVLRGILAAYVEYHRNVPLLVQVLIWYLALSQLLPDTLNTAINQLNSEMTYAVIALSLFSAAYMSEDIRSGLRAIPNGQYEAARAIGMGHLGAMIWIILPQALRLSAAPLINQTLVLFKATSIASAIGVPELTFQALQIESQTFRVFEAFSVVTAVYMTGSFLIMLLGNWFAKRTKLTRR